MPLWWSDGVRRSLQLAPSRSRPGSGSLHRQGLIPTTQEAALETTPLRFNKGSLSVLFSGETHSKQKRLGRQSTFPLGGLLFLDRPSAGRPARRGTFGQVEDRWHGEEVAHLETGKTMGRQLDNNFFQESQRGGF